MKNIEIKKFTFLTIIFATIIILYLLFIQSDRYLSVAKVIVNQSQSMESPSKNIGNLVVGQYSKNEDIQLIIEYIKSKEMLEYLDYSIDLRKIYSGNNVDYFSKLSPDSNKDSLFAFYLKHLSIKPTNDNSIISIEVESFAPEDSRKILSLIIRKSEEFINKIFNDIAKKQLEFVENEVLAKEKTILELEKKFRILKKKAKSTDSQIINSSLERKLDFAIQAHRESLSTLERIRIESAQSVKKLVVITGPTKEESASYPKRMHNLLLFLSIFMLVYFIIKSTYATITAHKSTK